MSSTSRIRVRSGLSGLLGLAIALASAASSAQHQVLVGVDTIRFAWAAPATGTPLGYLVSLSNGGAALTDYQWVSQPSIEIPVAPGDQITIAVAAGAYDSHGVFGRGPQSALSDQVGIFPSPRFPVDGEWLLQCASCPSLAVRSLADASRVLAEAPGLPAPWRVAGRAALDSGPDLVVWHNPLTGEMELWDSQDLLPIPGGTAVGPAARFVGGADFGGDGIEELVLQEIDNGQISLWALTPGGFERVATLPIPGFALLAAADDFTGDGKADLLFHDTASGTASVWKGVGNPLLGGSLGSLFELPPSPVVAGFPSHIRVADTGDYDGDGHTDVLCFSAGHLFVMYLDGRVDRFRFLPWAPNESVVGSVDVNGVPGDEIALQNEVTGAISILLLSAATELERLLVLTPGSQWSVVSVAE